MAKRTTNIKETTDINTGALLPQPRGFRLRTMRGNGKGYYVRIGYRPAVCQGEAHANAHIDHCSLCLGGVWGVVAVRDENYS